MGTWDVYFAMKGIERNMPRIMKAIEKIQQRHNNTKIMTLLERIEISTKNGSIDTTMGVYLSKVDEVLAGSMLDWLDWKHGQKILKEWSAMPHVMHTDRDSHDYLKGFYDGCKHHSKG